MYHGRGRGDVDAMVTVNDVEDFPVRINDLSLSLSVSIPIPLQIR